MLTIRDRREIWSRFTRPTKSVEATKISVKNIARVKETMLGPKDTPFKQTYWRKQLTIDWCWTVDVSKPLVQVTWCGW